MRSLCLRLRQPEERFEMWREQRPPGLVAFAVSANEDCLPPRHFPGSVRVTHLVKSFVEELFLVHA